MYTYAQVFFNYSLITTKKHKTLNSITNYMRRKSKKMYGKCSNSDPVAPLNRSNKSNDFLHYCTKFFRITITVIYNIYKTLCMYI